MIGKWHLGIGSSNKHLPINHGFDQDYYGIPCSNVQSCGGKSILSNPLFSQFPILFTIYRLYFIWLPLFLFIITFCYLFGRSKNEFVIGLIILFVIIIVVNHYIFNYTLLSKRSCLLMRSDRVVEQPVLLDNLTLKFTHEATSFLSSFSSRLLFFYLILIIFFNCFFILFN